MILAESVLWLDKRKKAEEDMCVATNYLDMHLLIEIKAKS